MNLPISDLRKGNLVRTEYGILPVGELYGNAIYAVKPDGRSVRVAEFAGIDLLDANLPDSVAGQIKDLLFKDFKRITDVDKAIIYVSDLQNWYYWNSGKKELEITL